MLLLVVLSFIFFASILAIVLRENLYSCQDNDAYLGFLPKSRTEMIKGIAAIAIVFSHIATYSKGAASCGLLRYYNLFLTSLGGIGVNLFFFVSGYGNYFSLLRNKRHGRRWIWKRCVTLLITYFVCFFSVLLVLVLVGYHCTLKTIVNELAHISIPYSSVWYVKIQLLVYFFLLFSITFEERKNVVLAITVLCFLSTIILFLFGMEDKWWKSTMCFAAGVYVGAYKSEIETILVRNNKRIVLIVFLFPFAYYSAILSDIYMVKIIGNLTVCGIIMLLAQILSMNSNTFYRIGSYSLPLYLVHRSLVAWILDDGATTNYKVVLIIILSVVLTVITKKISDFFVNISLEKVERKKTINNDIGDSNG